MNDEDISSEEDVKPVEVSYKKSKSLIKKNKFTVPENLREKQSSTLYKPLSIKKVSMSDEMKNNYRKKIDKYIIEIRKVMDNIQDDEAEKHRLKALHQTLINTRNEIKRTSKIKDVNVGMIQEQIEAVKSGGSLKHFRKGELKKRIKSTKENKKKKVGDDEMACDAEDEPDKKAKKKNFKQLRNAQKMLKRIAK